MIIFRGFIIWLIIVFAVSVHGTARRFLREPCIGDFLSRQISVLSGAIIIFAISFAFVRWIRATRKSELITVGIFWLVLTVLFEITLGKLILEYSWERIFSDYNLFKCVFIPILLFFIAFLPLIA